MENQSKRNWKLALYQGPHSHHTWLGLDQYIVSSSEKLFLATDHRGAQMENMQRETLGCSLLKRMSPSNPSPQGSGSVRKRKKEDCESQGCWIIPRQQ